jgi:hypothetical protein
MLSYYGCWTVGRIITSFSATSSSAAITNAIVRATASGLMASLYISSNVGFKSESINPSVNSVPTAPGEIFVARIF